MRKPWVWVAIAVVVALVAGGSLAWFLFARTDATAPKLARGPAPSFVVDHKPQDAAKARFEPVNGVQILLLDSQYDATASKPAFYQRTVKRAATVVGVPDTARTLVPFDPSYQKVVLNHARVMRDGKTEDRSKRVSATFATIEPDAALNIYSGRMVATLQIEDIRAGDVVDVGIAITGASPTLRGEHTEQFALNGPIGIETLVMRSVWPEDAIWKIDGDEKLAIKGRKKDGKLILEYGPAPVEALPIDFNSGVFPEFSSLMVSTFRDWRSVVAWAEPLYRFGKSKPVTELAARLKAENPDKGAQIIAALRFVQGDIRYLAIALGSGGYVPQSPDETLKLRYGDCKAKTVLFIALLGELGVNASPALVSAYGGAELADAISTPYVFDHVIAKVTYDGRTFWLDPTTPQGGDIDRIAQADLHYALPLERSVTSLQKMPRRAPAGPTIQYTQFYDLTGGVDAPAVFLVSAAFSGASADDMRQTVEASGGADKMMTEGMKLFFKKIEMLKPVATTDDLAANTLKLDVAARTGPSFDPSGPARFMTIQASGMSPVVFATMADEETDSDIPVASVHAQETIRIKLPVGPRWRLPAETQRLENKAFRFTRSTDVRDGEYVIALELKALASTISPKDLSAVLRDQKDMTGMSRLILWLDNPPRPTLPPLQFAGAPAAQ